MKRLCLIFVLLFNGFFVLNAQITLEPIIDGEISGPSSCVVGQNYNYSYFNDGVFGVTWNANGGTVISFYSSGGTHYATIRWDVTGSRTLTVSSWDLLASKTVSVSSGNQATTALSANQITSNSFNARWASISGASSYRLDVSTTSNFSSMVSGYNNLSVSGTNRVVTGLNPNTTYYYRVRVVYSSGTSGNSNTITTKTLLTAPTAWAANQITSHSFNARWSSVSGANSYRLDVATTSNFSEILPSFNNLQVSGTNLVVSNSSIVPGKTYYYRVRAVYSSGTSGNSNTRTVNTQEVDMSNWLISPNGNENFTIGESFPVIVNEDYFSNSTTMAVELWRNGNVKIGNTSYAGMKNRAIFGSQTQNIEPGSFYKVRVVNAAHPTYEDWSDNYFTISEYPIEDNWITSPNSSSFFLKGETISVDIDQNIWNPDELKVELYLGSAKVDEITCIPGNCILSTATLVSSPDYRVRVLDGPSVTRESWSDFFSIANMDYWLLSPRGGEVFSLGQDIQILVDANLYNPENIGFEVFQNGTKILGPIYGNGSSLIAPAVDLPLSEGSGYKVRVFDADNPFLESWSTGVFSRGKTENYVKVRSILKEGITEASEIENLQIEDQIKVSNYFDGVGRPILSNSMGQSPGKKDIIQIYSYDIQGREAKKYLPFATNEASGNMVHNIIDENGNFTGLAASFYNDPGNNVAQDPMPFSQTIFDGSPLNRIIKQGAPGADWQPDPDNPDFFADKTIKFAYQANKENEVIWWSDNFENSIPKKHSIEYYPSNRLYKNITYDEDNRMVVEYTNQLGQMVLKRAQIAEGVNPAINDQNFAATYYLYDLFGRLSTVLPPEATARLDQEYFGKTNQEKETFLQQWAFRYQYDGRGRMKWKQVPGAEPVYMVYDKRDRLVLTQDGNQRLHDQWMFTKYDALNRPVVTGIYTHSSTLDQEAMSQLISTNDFVESYTGTGPLEGYTNDVFPKQNLEVLSVTYYDRYDFLADVVNDNTFEYDYEALGGLPEDAFDRVKGQVTGTLTRILDTPDWITGVTWYDDRYRPIQTITSNHMGGYDKVSMVYNFPGWVMKTLLEHSSDHDAVTIAERMEYDHTGRLLRTWHKIDEADEILLTEMEYNEIGELVTKKLHAEDLGQGFRQHVDFRYNIRGWITRINNSDLTPDDSQEPADLFGMNLLYNEVGSGIGNDPLYNGNISAMTWSNHLGADEDLSSRAYRYTYDPLNRLKEAQHLKKSGAGWSSVNDYKTNYGYDLNGNILTLTRRDDTELIDNLEYEYTKGNQLDWVKDHANNDKGFKDGNPDGDDYSYDANGNMVEDKNKGITKIEYNHLNLPKLVEWDANKYIRYYYDAAGMKVAQEVYDQEPKKRTDYNGPFIYENDTLKLVFHAEGRILPPGQSATGDYEYQYHLKDHLGNTRVTFTTAEQADEYLATMEDPEAPEFLYYEEAVRINFDLFDHTDDGPDYYSQRLNGTANEQLGVAAVLQVLPGDAVEMEVYAKYLDPDDNNWTTALANFMSMLNGGSPPAGTIIDGGGIAPTGSGFSWFGLLGDDKDNDLSDGPKAYLNWILFDDDFNFIDGGFEKMSDVAKEDGSDVAHELLSAQVPPIKNPGYLYIYLSNEHDTPVEVYFDDFKVTHTKSPVVQGDDYYPFGLTFNSYQRMDSKKNHYLYNGKELQSDLDLEWYDYGWRNYDAVLGRFHTVDAFADKYYSLTPYQYGANNSIKYIDVNGDSLMLFKNGVYVTTVDNGKEEITGYNQESSIDEDGNETFTGGQSFSFNDIELDKNDLKSGKMTLNFMSQDDVDRIMSESGIENQNVLSRWSYAATESNSFNARGEGKMDFLGSGNAPYKKLSIINGVGYNSHDAGNYLWGYSMGKMGFTSIMSRTAAHMNAWWSAKLSNPEMASTNSNPVLRWFENRSWGGDSAADQRAIQNGLNDSGSYWENKRKSFKR